jgi:hypothetical protein
VRVERVQTFRCRTHFGFADLIGAVEDLPLQVGEIDGVIIDDADSSDAGRRKIGKHRRAESTRADAKHPRGA